MAPREHFFRRYTTASSTTKLVEGGVPEIFEFRVLTPLRDHEELGWRQILNSFFLILFVIFDMIFFSKWIFEKSTNLSKKMKKKNPYFILFWPHILADSGQYPKFFIVGTCSSIYYYQTRLREFDTLAGFPPSLFATFSKNILFTYWNFS